MHRNRWLWSIAGLAVFGAIVAGPRWLKPASRLNVLLVTLDTTRADRLGCYGHGNALTPVMDRLSERGVLFERAYAPVPLTLPSHASMLTGLYPPEHGLHLNGQGVLPEGLATLATELQSAGYATGAFIAAAVLEQKFGLARGFNVYDDNPSGTDESLLDHHRYRPATTVIDQALAWLKRGTSKPFFCWVHLFDPHFPYQTHSERFGDRFAENPYDGEIAFVDAQLGRLISVLDRSGELDRTMIVIVGDHGESLDEHGERTHSMTLYDAALRVPLLISVSGECRPGLRIADPVSLVDLCPTVLDCLDIDPIPESSGRSLRPLLRGDSLPDRACYAETDEPHQTARWSPLRALITSRWKYVRSPKAELYDLVDDPHELRNVAVHQPQRVQEFETELAAWEQRMHRRVAGKIHLSEQDRRKLSSLGYVAPSRPVVVDHHSLADVKDMLGYYNLLNDADAMMDAGRFELAEPVLREILAADDEYFRAHGSLGMCLLRLNRVSEAIVHLRRNVELDPEADRVQAMLGTALFLNGDYREAVEALQSAVRLNPDLYEAHYNLGLTLEKLGRAEDAIECYQTCLELLPHFAPARQRLSALLR